MTPDTATFGIPMFFGSPTGGGGGCSTVIESITWKGYSKFQTTKEFNSSQMFEVMLKNCTPHNKSVLRYN